MLDLGITLISSSESYMRKPDEIKCLAFVSCATESYRELCTMCWNRPICTINIYCLVSVRKTIIFSFCKSIIHNCEVLGVKITWMWYIIYLQACKYVNTPYEIIFITGKTVGENTCVQIKPDTLTRCLLIRRKNCNKTRANIDFSDMVCILLHHIHENQAKMYPEM